MRRKSKTLSDVEAQIVMTLHSQTMYPVTDLIRALRFGGETFYRHKEVLVREGLLKINTVKNSGTRTVNLELTDNGTRIAVLLEKIAEILPDTSNDEIIST